MTDVFRYNYRDYPLWRGVDVYQSTGRCDTQQLVVPLDHTGGRKERRGKKENHVSSLLHC